jgi:hypothetical protein
MSGLRQGTVYLTDQSASPITPQPNHKALYTLAEGVFVIDAAGNSVRLDDYSLIQSVSGALSTEISAGLSSQAVALWQGNVTIPSGQYVIPVSYTPAVNLTDAYPVVSLKGPASDSIIYPLSIINRTTTGFQVVLGGAPDVSGYSIDWFMAAGGAAAAGGGSGGGSGSGTPTTIVGGDNISAIENPAGTWTISVTGSTGTSNPVVVTDSGTSFSPDGLADVYDYTLTASASINAPSSLVNGRTILFKLTQPVGGLATLNLVNGGGLSWKIPNGVLNLSTDVGGAIDILTVVRIGNDLFVSSVKNLQ